MRSRVIVVFAVLVLFAVVALSRTPAPFKEARYTEMGFTDVLKYFDVPISAFETEKGLFIDRSNFLWVHALQITFSSFDLEKLTSDVGGTVVEVRYLRAFRWSWSAYFKNEVIFPQRRKT